MLLVHRLRLFIRKRTDHELAVVTMKSKRGSDLASLIHGIVHMDMISRVELFGKEGMLISGNKKSKFNRAI